MIIKLHPQDPNPLLHYEQGAIRVEEDTPWAGQIARDELGRPAGAYDGGTVGRAQNGRACCGRGASGGGLREDCCCRCRQDNSCVLQKAVHDCCCGDSLLAWIGCLGGKLWKEKEIPWSKDLF